jgi:hypothetical protein
VRRSAKPHEKPGLRLASSQAFATGVLHLIYIPVGSAPTGTYDDAKAHLPQPDNN